MPEPAPPPHPEQTHNHQQCIDIALASAKQLCIKKSVNLTPIREQVLTIILQNHQPSGAYSILDALAEAAEPRAKPAPPTVYRALEFLLDQQLIHRITSLNAYIACRRPARSHQGHFLICQVCQQVLELNEVAVSEAINASAKERGFEVIREGVEVFGICEHCQHEASTR